MQDLHFKLSDEPFKNTSFSNVISKIIRAPGRVNLIGEHTDYNGLPVLPIAIDREIRMEIIKRDDPLIVLVNRNSKFDRRIFSIDIEGGERIPSYEMGDWGNYVKAGLQGVMDEFQRRGMNSITWNGFSAFVSGNIPIASGLSSSSALVVASSLAFMEVNGLEMSGVELAELTAKAERYVGTEGGGMDQAISILAKPGHALKIDFFPLRVRPVKMDRGYKIVVCKSMIEAPKTKEARMKFNRRPIECRLACAVMLKALKNVLGLQFSCQRIGDIVREVDESILQEVTLPVLWEKNWSLSELSDYLEMDIQMLTQKYLTLSDVSVFPEPDDGFKLGKRVEHVISEGRRVERAAIALEEGNMELLGRLMNESHTSCKDNYEISCEELDVLVKIARNAGAIGSRLTGAGFGGCTVNLVKEELVFDFVRTVKEKYYGSYLRDKYPSIYGELYDYSDIIFICGPSAGASKEVSSIERLVTRT